MPGLIRAKRLAIEKQFFDVGAPVKRVEINEIFVMGRNRITRKHKLMCGKPAIVLLGEYLNVRRAIGCSDLGVPGENSTHHILVRLGAIHFILNVEPYITHCQGRLVILRRFQ
nr:hypothetical protein BHNBIJOD_00025 [Klebsiella pneumoniae]WLE92545.1 hypothetical protein BHNBIJOD_00172 [Klebsiella pneumoniae]